MSLTRLFSFLSCATVKLTYNSVAGVVGAERYDVAPSVNIITVKVLGTTSRARKLAAAVDGVTKEYNDIRSTSVFLDTATLEASGEISLSISSIAYTSVSLLL